MGRTPSLGLTGAMNSIPSFLNSLHCRCMAVENRLVRGEL